MIWGFGKFSFIDKDKDSQTINPSLVRQTKLNNINALFKVTDRIYQVRGFDLSVMSFIHGEDSWIVIDPLLS
ncbi:hypothetical protein [Shewanella kaireitica]|uniref:hypothetical protein n=1 Tax=Shewanella kaireitica TaxID=212021 RepID=UPI0020108149|nr:hypothetical protein [Shewanella kaireitica]MCL1092845.1 hypothetical protein [Shewanella kaireitica]